MKAEPLRVEGWWVHAALFAATGVLLALAFPLPGWSWLGFVALAPAAVAVGGSRRPGRVFLTAFAVFALWFLWMLRWLWPVSGPGVLGLAPFTALFPAAALGIANLCTRRGKVPLVLALPVCWVAGEWLRSTQPWGGFAWFLLGHTQGAWEDLTTTQVPSLAQMGGVPLVSLILAVFGCFFGFAMLKPVAKEQNILLVAWLVVLTIFSFVETWVAPLDALDDLQIPVAAIQTNNPHSNRVAPTYEDLAAQFRTLSGLHRDAAEPKSGPKPALILWPETVVPGPFNRDEAGRDQSPFATAARQLIDDCGVPTVVGGSFSLEGEGTPRHNSAYLVMPGEPVEAQRHDKVHRVPFGEYIPGPAWLKSLVLDHFSPYDFDYTLTPGVLNPPFELPLADGRTLRFATPICFEDTDPKLTRRMAEGGAEALLNLTTSGWFGYMPTADRPGGGLAWRSVRAQHLQIATFRSLETGLPTLRAVNTGDSALVTGAGFIRAALPPGEAGVLRAELPLPAGGGGERTLYLRGGYLFAPANALLALALLVFSLLPGKNQSKPQRAAEPRKQGHPMHARKALQRPRVPDSRFFFLTLFPLRSSAVLCVLCGLPGSSRLSARIRPATDMPQPMPRLRLLLTVALCLAPVSAAPALAAAQNEVPLRAAPADPDAEAVSIILEASRSDRAELRANAVEAIQHAPGRALPLVQAALDDENPGVRFAALFVVGKQEMEGLAPAVRDLLAKSDEPNASVRAATLFAAAKLGLADDATLSEMSRYLFHSDPRVRANAVLLMGDLEMPSAALMLRHASARPEGDKHPQIEWAILRLQVAEALAKLGDAPPDPTAVAPDTASDTAGIGLRAVRAATYSTFDEVRVLAVQALGRLEDEAFWGNLNNFLNPGERQPIEFKLAAAQSLGQMGRGGNLLWAVLPAATHELPTVRSQAAFALGSMPQPEARDALARLLADPDPAVRVAAAAAWLEASSR